MAKDLVDVDNLDSLNAQNASVLAEIIVDPLTSDALRVSILNKLLEIVEGQTFFQTIFKENLSFGSCPGCGHNDHWLIPVDQLAEMHWIIHEKDPKVPRNTDKNSCKQWAEACHKKKISI
jgi:hypothetical protein